MMNERYRKVLLIGAAALLVMLGFLAAVPLLLRGPLEARIRTEVNDRVNAEVAWGGVGLSLLRSFPNATLSLRDLSIAGVGSFEGDTLAQVPDFRVVVDARSVIGSLRGTSPLVVRSIDMRAPAVRLVVLEDGRANWNIAVADEEEPARPGRPLDVALRSLRIRGGVVSLDDRHTGMQASARGVSHTLAGDLRQTRVTLRTRTGAEAVSVRFAGMPFLSRADVAVDANLDLDRIAERISIADAAIRVNALRLALDGSIGFADDPLALDLAFEAPSTDIREILSLIPAIQSGGTANLETAGSMSVSGWIRGGYGEDAFPAFAADVSVRDGMFRYPQLELPAREIDGALSITNRGGDADHTVVQLSRFRALIGGAPIEGRLSVHTPVSDPLFDLRVAGRLDLADLARTIVLEGVEQLEGIIAGDAELIARVSDIDAQRYEHVHAAGDLRVDGVALRSAELAHPLHVDEAVLRISPAQAEIVTLRGRAGSSDATVTGRLDNPLGYALRGDPLKVSGRITSNRVDLNEWRSDDELETILVPHNLDLTLDAEVAQVALADLDLRNARGSLRVLDQRATLEGFRMESFGGTITAAGAYETTNPSRPTFDFALSLQDIDVSDAAARVTTARHLAPFIAYAAGRISTELQLSGALGADLAPLLPALAGRGSLETEGISLQGFPALTRLADRLNLDVLRDPTFADVRAVFTIRDGRVHVSPFDVPAGPVRMTVSGSHGLDQTLDYALAMQVPTGPVGGLASQALTSAAARLGRPEAELRAADRVTVGARITGTVADPNVALDPGATTSSLAADAQSAIEGEISRRAGEIEGALDDAAATARAAAEAEAARRGAELRAAALQRAETTRREAREQADALIARASNPIARAAAQRAADRLLREADEEADRIVREGEARANAFMEESGS